MIDKCAPSLRMLPLREKKVWGIFFSFRFLKILNKNEKLGGGNHKKIGGATVTF